jgi:hypothetical protein
MTWAWGLLAALALLWPGRVAGPLDGVPLDRVAEALAIGVLFPFLWWLHPRFLRTALARACIVSLAVWHVAAASLLTQQGWCVRFEPGQPYVVGQTGAPHAWDLRADWRSADPACSAIMTRPYRSLEEFPAWFFNLPPADEGWPGPRDRPPGAMTKMTVRGFVDVDEPGILRIEAAPDAAVAWSVDGGAPADEARLEPGAHLIAADVTLTGERWRFAPLWNDRDIWSELTTVRRPTGADRLLGRRLAWLPGLTAFTLLAAWLIATLRRVNDPALLAWSSGASLVIAALVVAGRVPAARLAVAALVLAAAVPVRPRSRNLRGAFITIGVPWFAFVTASAASAVGRFVIYEVGHDYWLYQRFAYRIVMQGRWIEGGSPTFWFQPLYRWIVAALHLVFGDSSVGEWFWDGACLLAIVLFAYRVVRPRAGHRWAIAAGVCALAIFVVGTPQYLIGRGLGEISSAGLLAGAALLAMRSRTATRYAIGGGALAALAFYTRLNNLPMAFGAAVFAWRRGRPQPAVVMTAVVAASVVLFAVRTWYFTGVFSLFEGTQRNLLAIWQPGIGLRTGIARTVESVLMVLTVNDPPRFDPLALPVLGGAAVAALALVSRRVRWAVPMPAVLFLLSGLAGAFVARGSAYPGRFSLHVLGPACALSACAASAILARVSSRPRKS